MFGSLIVRMIVKACRSMYLSCVVWCLSMKCHKQFGDGHCSMSQEDVWNSFWHIYWSIHCLLVSQSGGWPVGHAECNLGWTSWYRVWCTFQKPQESTLWRETIEMWNVWQDDNVCCMFTLEMHCHLFPHNPYFFQHLFALYYPSPQLKR